MLVQTILLIAGLLLILCGAHFLVDGSSNIARRSGISEFVIGLTIVGIGTSTPEMVVSFYSAIQGNADVAVGNIVGSNIFNTALILGITAAISPLVITRNNLLRDIPANILASILLIVFGLNLTLFGLGSNTISRVDGGILLLVFAVYMFLSFRYDKGGSPENGLAGARGPGGIGISIVMILGGLAALIIGGRLFVDSASHIAEHFGVPDAFIAITVLAGGTSLPELATCIVAAAKGKGQLALGNILGSNISNILLIIGGSALIHPLALKSVTPVDLGMLLLLSVILFTCAYIFKKKTIDRIEGVILLLVEACYVTWLITSL